MDGTETGTAEQEENGIQDNLSANSDPEPIPEMAGSAKPAADESKATKGIREEDIEFDEEPASSMASMPVDS